MDIPNFIQPRKICYLEAYLPYINEWLKKLSRDQEKLVKLKSMTVLNLELQDPWDS